MLRDEKSVSCYFPQTTFTPSYRFCPSSHSLVMETAESSNEKIYSSAMKASRNGFQIVLECCWVSYQLFFYRKRYCSLSSSICSHTIIREGRRGKTLCTSNFLQNMNFCASQNNIIKGKRIKWYWGWSWIDDVCVWFWSSIFFEWLYEFNEVNDSILFECEK